MCAALATGLRDTVTGRYRHGFGGDCCSATAGDDHAAADSAVRRVAASGRRLEGVRDRDLVTLKRTFALTMQGGQLIMRLYIPLLEERNVRKGFFEREQLQSISSQPPPYGRGHRGVRVRHRRHTPV